MKLRVRKRLGLIIATALFVGLNGASALAIVNPDNAILNGTYKAVGQDAGFSQGVDWLNAQLSGDSGTLTFDGAGNCTATFAGSSFGLSLGVQNPVNVYTNNDPTIACTYDVNGDGSVSLTHPEGTETFWTNPDGTVILDGGAESGPGDQAGVTDYETSQFLAVKTGPAGPKGTFHAVSQDAAFWQNPGGVSVNLYGNGVTLNFNGTGGCSFSLAGSNYDLNTSDPYSSVTASPESGSGTCTYTYTDGEIAVTLPTQETFAFQLGSNGNVILQGGAKTESDGGDTGYGVTQMVAVKAGSTMTLASLQGLFHMVSQDASFWGPSTGGGVSVNLYGNQGTLTFNGAGVCSYAFDGSDFSVSPGQYPSINSSANSDSGPCTYAVAASGKVTLTHPEGTETFWLSADGMTLISGGARKQIETGSTGYEVNQMVGVKIDPYVGVNVAPASVTVPAVDPDGNYLVSWAAAENGVTYVLEEAKDSEFLTGKRTAYRGKNLSFGITLRPKGQSYYYRVRSERTGYAPSEWSLAANPCNVGTPLLPATITVPASDTDGTYTINWKASLTPGVTYVVEEATDALFVNVVDTYIGSDIAWPRSGNTTGTIYYYRVKVQKDGFTPAESLWKKALNPCKVGLLAPGVIYVPSSAGPSYEVSWDASLTPDVTYKLQEATNAAFTTGLRTLSTANTLIPITGRVAGKTYYYRVRAIKLNYLASPWTATSSCAVSNIQ